MHLWTEYEGNTVAGFTLGRLSRSEGRSAFFLTETTDNKPALLRLTESHFDEGELTTRWQAAAKVSHPHLQAIYQSGQTTFEGTSLAWCLLEANDASLSDILPERSLTRQEALQVTEAVAGALDALHTAGLVHEHVDSTNVFAMGETVKLRIDCVRECTGDFEADTPEARNELRKRDVSDLGVLLQRCLTAPGQDVAETQLPSPFDRMVRRALNGSVNAEGIVAEVEALKPAPPPVPRSPAPVNAELAANDRVAVGSMRASASASMPVVPSQVRSSQGTAAAARNGIPAAARSTAPYLRPPADSATTAPPVATPSRTDVDGIYAGLPRPGAASGEHLSPAGQAAPVFTAVPASSQVATERSGVGRLHASPAAHARSAAYGDTTESLPARLLQHRGWLAGGAVAALLGIVLWSTVGNSHHATAPGKVPASVPSSTHASPAPAVIAVQQPGGTPANASQSSLLASGQQAGWRVIAYTYNYEKQAEAKVTQLRRRHFSMQPQVFSPSGHAPYFVALGGPSDAETAMALRNRARRSGLPRDTFARNF